MATTWEEYRAKAAADPLNWQKFTLDNNASSNPFATTSYNPGPMDYYVTTDPNNSENNLFVSQLEDGRLWELSQAKYNDIDPWMALPFLGVGAGMAAAGAGLAGAAGSGAAAGGGAAAAGGGAAAGGMSLAEAMAAYAPSFGSELAAAGMGAPAAVGTAGAAGTAGGLSLADAMATYAPEFGAELAASGMGAPAATGGTNALSSFLGTAKDVLNNPLTSVGTSLINGVMGDRAASKAADAQRDAATTAIGEQRRQYDQTRADLAPYRNRGYQAGNRLAVMMGLNPDSTTYGNGNPQQDPLWMKGMQSAPKYQAPAVNAFAQYAPFKRG